MEVTVKGQEASGMLVGLSACSDVATMSAQLQSATVAQPVPQLYIHAQTHAAQAELRQASTAQATAAEIESAQVDAGHAMAASLNPADQHQPSGHGVFAAEHFLSCTASGAV